MSKLFSLFLLSVFTTTYSQSNKLDIQHLSGNLFVYTTYKNLDDSPFPSNSMYLITDSGAVLFDTPWDTTQFQPIIDSIKVKHGKKVILCLVTHSHDDRTAGLDYYKSLGIKTYSSKQTLETCIEKNEPQSEFYFVNDTTFIVGEAVFSTFYPGEGHSTDNIVIWFPADKVLYAGCLVKSAESKGLGNLEDANLADWPQTLDNLLKKYPDPNFVIPGHQGWSNSGSVKHTVKLLKRYDKTMN